MVGQTIIFITTPAKECGPPSLHLLIDTPRAVPCNQDDDDQIIRQQFVQEVKHRDVRGRR